MRFTFTFNGISNHEMGVIVSQRPPLKTPQQKMKFYNVDGTYGSISRFMGFEPISNQMEIIVESQDYLDTVKGWLTGVGKFTRSDRPNMYQEIHIIDVLEFERLPHSTIYTGTLTYVSYYPIWRIKDEIGNLVPKANHGTSWNYAYTLENKGTIETQPIIDLSALPPMQIKVGDGTVQVHQTYPTLIVNTLTGEVMTNEGRNDSVVTWFGDITLKHGDTMVYCDNDISSVKFIEPSSFI